ncbi:cytochrome P450 2K6-like [Ruditapes philippinarum]|uniref:cytochrome P450 2K6-like n=1 Tax=Ruditapes philippinarum TaxID=129788 RepID=UPI00295BA7A8|nr:cytochrome P450 2K6-like [Ruditapes philippinarum]
MSWITLSGSIPSTCLVGLVVGLVVYWLLQKWKYSYPPGPPGLPLVGNALQIDLKGFPKQVFEWSKKYGPVVTIRTGPVQFITVNTIETALEVLVRKSTDFCWA